MINPQPTHGPDARLETSHPEVAALARECPETEIRSFDDGDYLIRQGETGTDIFLVVRGAFVVERAAPDRPDSPATALATVLVDPEQPAFVGEMAYLGTFARTASVRCSGRTVALQLRPAHLDVVINRFPALTRSLCKQFTERLKSMNDNLLRFEQLLAMKTQMLVKSEGDTLVRRGEKALVLHQLVDGEIMEAETETAHFSDSLPAGFVEPLSFLRGAEYASTWIVKAPSIIVGIDASSRLAVIRNYPELLMDAISR